MKFEHCTPESAGLDSQHILDFLDEMTKKNVPLHSFLLFSGESILAEGYFEPYTKESLHRMFSITKSFTAIAVGILIGDKKLALSDPVIRYFPDKVPSDVHPWIAEMTIENLLMMRTCHASTTYRNGGTDWVGSFFTTPPTHKPGTVFHYDTSAAHVLAALVERISGIKLLDFLKERLDVLGLSPKSYILADPEGVSMGGTGLVATTQDLLRFGYLLLQGGRIGGTQLVPSDFLARATSRLTATCVTAPLPSEACGYGCMIWQTERNGYVCYGMGGQLLMVFPDKRLIFITTADTQGLSGGNQLIYDAFYRHIYDRIGAHAPDERLTLPADTMDVRRALDERLKSLALAPLPPYAASSRGGHAALCRRFDGRSYRIVNTLSAASSEKGEVVSVFTRFSFIFNSQERGVIQFRLRGQDCSLAFGFGQMETGQFPVYNLSYAASGTWLDEHTLYVRFHIIDRYVGSVHMQFYFGEDDITIFMKKVEESCFHEFSGHFYGIIL